MFSRLQEIKQAAIPEGIFHDGSRYGHSTIRAYIYRCIKVVPKPPKKSRLLIHIGTGKTATTSLQHDVFPLLHSINKIVYLSAINKDLKHILQLYRLSKDVAFKPLQERISALRHRISMSIASRDIPHLISLESLHGWDPGTWEDWLGLNKQLFSDLADTVEIVISIRNTKSYLDSVYMQMIHQGFTYLTPDTFFLQSDAYEIAKKYLGVRSQGVEIFCIDKLIYSNLFTTYCNSFDACYCFTMEEILSLEFLRELNLYDNALQAKQLSKNLAIYNKSYSDAAYRLTLARERLLEAFDLRSRSSLDSQSRLMINILLSSPRLGVDESAAYSPQVISVSSITSKLLLKIRGFLLRRLQWRYIMQRCVNKCIPYKKPILDYGFCDFKGIELLNDAFMKKPMSDRVFFKHNANTRKSLEH